MIKVANKAFITTILMGFICSCTNQNVKNVPIEIIEGRPVNLDPAYYGMRATLLCGDILFTWSKAHEETCCIGVLTKDSLTNYQGGFRRGHGKNEFQEIALARGIDSSVYVAAFPSSRNMILSVTKIPKAKDIGADKDAETWIKYDLTNPPSFRCVFHNFISLSDSTMLVLGAPYGEMEHLMSIIDFKNQKLMPLDYWPNDMGTCNDFVKQGVYTDTGFIFKNDNDRFLYVCGEGNFAFIFTIEGVSVKVIKELYSYFPQYEYAGDDRIGRMNYSIKNRPALRFETDVNGKHIYILRIEHDKNGRVAENWRTSVCGNAIEVYDWDGNLEKIIKLNKYGKNIKVKEDDKLLYLFSEDWETGEPQIWAYDLGN